MFPLKHPTLLKVFSVEDALDYVLAKFESLKSHEFPDNFARSQSVVNQLVNEAVRRGTTDNVSAILVTINSAPKTNKP
eukprot:m.172181 g.172181  ORF g.172181 m.172181 type:complete len:78 (+) comp15362_c0_seq2:1187-1420(+)